MKRTHLPINTALSSLLLPPSSYNNSHKITSNNMITNNHTSLLTSHLAHATPVGLLRRSKSMDAIENTRLPHHHHHHHHH